MGVSRNVRAQRSFLELRYFETACTNITAGLNTQSSSESVTMEHRRSLINTAEALHRVFLTGTLPRPHFHPRLLPYPPPPQHQRKRSAMAISKRYAAGQNQSATQSNSRHARSLPLRDENINAGEVHLVLPDGKLQPAQPLRTILSSIDRKTHFVVQVSAPSSDATAHPVCKIIDKQSVRAAERAKAKPVKNAQTTTKQLELNWAIGANDLAHRLKKMEEFLAQGRRVEVVLAGKKKGRVASGEEAEGVVARIRRRIAEVEGAKEWREGEGAVGGQMTLFFEGTARK